MNTNSIGTIYSYTIVTSAAEAFKDKTPYVLALVEENGAKVLAFIDSYRENMEIKIGDKVECIGTDDSGKKVYKFLV